MALTDIELQEIATSARELFKQYGGARAAASRAWEMSAKAPSAKQTATIHIAKATALENAFEELMARLEPPTKKGSRV